MPEIDSSLNFIFTAFMLCSATIAVRQQKFRPGVVVVASLVFASLFVFIDEQALYYYAVDASKGRIPANPGYITVFSVAITAPYLFYKLKKRPTLHGWMLSVSAMAVVVIGVGYHVLIVNIQLLGDFQKHQVNNMMTIAISDTFDEDQCEPFGYSCFSRDKSTPPNQIKSDVVRSLPEVVTKSIMGVHDHYNNGDIGGFGGVILIDSGDDAYGYYYASGGGEYRLVIDRAYTEERLVMSRNLLRGLLLFAQISWILISWSLLLFHCWYLPRRRRLNRGSTRPKLR